MAKISMRHCAAQAYGLVFGQPFTLIGLTWLPALFYAEAASTLIRRMDTAMAVAVPSASGILGQYALFYFALLVVATALFGAVIAIPLTRQAFGLRDARVAVHLVVGAREVRLFFALVRYYALVAVTLLIFVIAAGIAISQGLPYAAAHGVARDWLGVPFQTWLNSGAAAIAVLLFLVFAVRFGFLLNAVAAVEDHARLARAHALSGGNFWRIAATLFVVVVPAGLVFLACEMTFGGLVTTGSSYSVATANTMSFAGILAGALVVLHALVAGASAAAYGELAEARENEPAAGFRLHQPAMAFAPRGDMRDEPHFGTSVLTGASEAPAFFSPMEVATPEAENAVASATLGPWMPPPPDAHFGSDSHDTLPQEVEVANTAEPLAEAASETQEVDPEIRDMRLHTGASEPAQASVHPDVDDAAADADDHAGDGQLPAPAAEVLEDALPSA